MKHMQAIYLTKHGDSQGSFEIRETPIPVPGPNDVVIAVAAFGLNFADVLARRGLYPDAPKNPAVLGYDVAGTIHALGTEVKGLKIGQRVTALTRFGGYAEYAKTMSEGVAPIPDSMDFGTATALATQGCTAYFCAEESVTLHKGDHVLIQAAAGGVGSLLVQLAKFRGCTVWGTSSSHKIDFLKDLGVDHPIDYTKEDFYSHIREKKGKMGIDVVFDSIGGKAFKQGMKLLAPGGRMVNFGAASQVSGGKANKLKALGVAFNFGLFSPISLLMQSRSLIAVNMLRIADHRPHVFKQVLESVVEMSGKGIIHPKLGRSFPVSQLADAHDYLESRQSIGKIVVEWRK